MLFGALWGNSALHLHHQELPEDCAFLLVGSAMLQARPAPAPLPVPRQHMEHPVVEGTVKLLKLRGLLVAQDEAAARAALYGLPIGYSPVVLRSFGDRYFHDFLNHGLPVPYLLVRDGQYGLPHGHNFKSYDFSCNLFVHFTRRAHANSGRSAISSVAA